MKTRKFLAMLLSLVMVIGLMTPAAMATEETEEAAAAAEEVAAAEETVVAKIVGGAEYTSLEEAAKAAKSGDTVQIMAGTYAVPTIKAGVTYEGVGDVLLEGTLSGDLDNITMKNLHIKGGNAQRWAYAKGNLLFDNVTFEARFR